jgi:hypothetical protein
MNEYIVLLVQLVSSVCVCVCVENVILNDVLFLP